MELGKICIEDRAFFSLVDKYGIKTFSVFGSVLRDDFGEDSDLDILIEFSNPGEKGLFDLIDLQIELEELTGREVDVIEKGAVKNPYRDKEISSTARLVYAA